MDMHEVVFEWPQTGPKTVIITGSFDKWSSKRKLTKTATGFVGTIKIPWNEKILYKYIVDGDWALVYGRPVEVESGTGFINHVYIAPPKPPVILPASEPESVAPTATTAESSKKNVSIPISTTPASGAVAVNSPVAEKPGNELLESSVVSIVAEVASPAVDDTHIRPVEPIHVDVGETSIADAKSDSGTTAVADPDVTADLPVHTPTEVDSHFFSSPSKEPEVAEKKKSGKPSPFPATPTKGEVFPNVSPPSSPSRFSSLRGSGKKKRTPSFFAKLKEVFKSEKEKEREREKEKEKSDKEHAELKL